MARAWNRLSANFVRGVTGRGRYADGGGLYLQVARGGTRAWVFLYVRNGTARAMGLGSTRSVPLALARELAAQAREQLARGIDPLDARKAAALAQRAARAKLTTFRQCAEEYHAANLARWRNAKHRNEWLSTLRRFAFPVIGQLSVSSIDSGHIYRVLLPLVSAKAVTAARVRGRIETVLDYAKAAGQRDGDNPAGKAIIGHMLPLRSEKANVVHQAALPFLKLPTFMAVLRARAGTTARMLEIIILTGMRSNAVRLARFDEFDLTERVWTVPQGRMKSLKRDHRIPLGPRAVEIVRQLRAETDGEFVFGGSRPGGKNLVGKLMPKLLKTIGHEHAVAHGFRSALKDWAHEVRDYPAEVIEQALGHRIRSSVERAYRRGDLFERRKVLMADWECFCAGDEASGEVVRLRA
jgi:integrase